jgi:hypothetical protein
LTPQSVAKIRHMYEERITNFVIVNSTTTLSVFHV